MMGLDDLAYQAETNAAVDLTKLAMTMGNREEGENLFGTGSVTGLNAADFVNKMTSSEIVSDTMIDWAFGGEEDTLTLDPVGGRVTRGDRKIFLSKLEFDLLEYLLRHQGCTVSKRTILSEIWDYKAAMNDHVVEMGVCSLRKKINWTGERKIIDTVRGLGYVIG